MHVYVDDKGDMRALDAATGRKKWEFTGRWADRLWAAGGLVYTRTVVEPISMCALDAATGARKWEFVSPTNAFAGGLSSAHRARRSRRGAYVVGSSAKDYDQKVHAPAAVTGTEKWTSAISGSSLRIGDGVLYVVSENKEAVYALDTAAGARA